MKNLLLASIAVAVLAASDDNAGVVELLDNRRTGVLAVVEEASELARANDGALAAKIGTLHRRSHPETSA